MLIWVYTVYLCPFYRTPGINRLTAAFARPKWFSFLLFDIQYKDHPLISPLSGQSQSCLNPPWSCWSWIYPTLQSVDPDQLAEANWSGSALFVIKYVNLYQQPGSSNLIGWKLEVGVAS